MLSLTDIEIKDLSLTTLQLPLVIDNPVDGTGLVQTKATIVQQKADLLTLDTQNKIFTDHWIGVALNYHTELTKLNSVIKTLYSESTLVGGAHNQLPHYDDTVWFNLVPIVAASSVGNPTSVSGSEDENQIISPVPGNIDKMVNGFIGTGVDDLTIEFPYTVGDGELSLFLGDSLTSGDLIIVDDGTNSMLALVGSSSGVCTGEDTPPQLDQAACELDNGVWTETTGITPISTDKNFPAGARVRNFHIGFTNAERGQQGAPNYAFDVMIHFQDLIDPSIANWQSNLLIQKTNLEANADLAPAAQGLNTTALANVDALIAILTTWEGTIIIDVNGRFTDTPLIPINLSTSSRPAQITTRIGDINTNLGPLTQAGDGAVSGAGVYASLYEFVNIRIGKAGGTLFGHFNLDLSISYYDTQIATTQGQLAQYNNVFAIATNIGDTVVGEIEFEVDSVSEFSVGQEVKIMDNDSVVFTRTIDTIIGTTITLDSGITAALTIASIARIVRLK